MDENVKNTICRLAKNEVSRLKRKKELTPIEFNKIALYEGFISQGCKPKTKKKETGFEAINRIRKNCMY